MTFKYGIKLPRKRKKAFLAYFAKRNTSGVPDKQYAQQCYAVQGIVCEILWENKQEPRNRSFYTYSKKDGYRAIISKKF